MCEREKRNFQEHLKAVLKEIPKAQHKEFLAYCRNLTKKLYQKECFDDKADYTVFSVDVPENIKTSLRGETTAANSEYYHRKQECDIK